MKETFEHRNLKGAFKTTCKYDMELFDSTCLKERNDKKKLEGIIKGLK